MLFCIVWVLTDGSHITGLGGMKKEIQDLKPESESTFNQVNVIIDGKVSKIVNNWKTLKKTLSAQ